MSAASLNILMTADAVGGVWTYAVELGGTLVERGHRVALAVTGPRASPAQCAEAENASLTILPEELPLDWLCEGAEPVLRGGERLAELARSYDVLLLNSPALAADARFTLPVIAVAHGEVGTWWAAVRGADGGENPFGWLTNLIGRGLRRAAQVVTPTAAYGALLRERYHLPAAPVAVHNGRTALALPQPKGEPPFALTVGRLWDGAKNISVLDRAAAMTNVPIRAAGAAFGPQGERAQVTHLEHLGSLSAERLAALLAERPVFVTSAVYEPFGLAVLEAAQASCPLVLSDIQNFRELWNGAATFVDPHDAEGFARAIKRPQVSGAAAQERATRYTVAAMTDEMLEVIDSTMATAHAA